MLVDIAQWIQDKGHILFSGIGVYVIGGFFTLIGLVIFRKRSSGNKVKMKNIIAGGDVSGRDKRGK